MSDVIINFVGHTAELKPAVDAYESLIQKDAELGNEVRKTAAIYAQRTKEVGSGNSKLSQSFAEIANGMKNADKAIVGGAAKQSILELQKQLQVTGKELKSFYEGIRNNARQNILAGGTTEQLKQFESELTAATQLLKMFDVAEKGVGKSSDSLKSQLRAQVEQLALLEEQGKRNTKEYNDLVAAAGNIRDAISDANDAIKNAGSDTQKLDNLISVVGALAGAFAIGQSAIALFGIENEDVQQVLAKTQAAMTLLAGVQQIQDFLSKRQAASLAVLLGIRQADVAAQTAETVATAANTTATTAAVVSTEALAIAEGEQVVATTAATTATAGATVATRLWNAVLSANPLVVVITLVTAAAAAIHIFSDNADDAAESQKKFNDSLEQTISINNQFIKAIKQGTAETVADLEASGASQTRIRRVELAGLREQVVEVEKLLNSKVSAYRAADDKLNAIGTKEVDARKKDDPFIEQLVKTKETYEELQSQYFDLQSEYRIKAANNQRDANKEKAEAQEAALKKQEELDKKAKDLADKNQKESEQKQKELKAIEVAGFAELRKLRQENYLSEIQDEEDRAKEKITQEYENERDRIKALKISETLRLELLLQLRLKEVNAIYAIEKKAQDLTKEAEETSAKNRMAAALAQLARLTAIGEKNELDALESLQRKKLISQEEYLKRKAKLTGDYAALESFEADKEAAAVQKRIDNFKSLFTESQNFLNEAVGVNVFTTSLTQLENFGVKAAEIYQQIKEGSITTAEGMTQLMSAGFDVLKSVANQFFADSKASRQQDLSEQLASIDQVRQQELDNANLTKQQRTDIEKKYKEQEKQAKRQAFIADRDAAVTQALITGALNLLKAFPNPFLMGAAGLLTAAQVALISSKQPPRYKLGKKKGEAVPGSGWAVVDDGQHNEPIWRKDGTVEISTGKPADRLTYLHRDDAVFPSMQAMLDRFQPPNPVIPKNISFPQSGSSTPSFDYDKLATAIAGKIPASKNVYVNVDKNGIALISQEANDKTEYKNRRWSL